jgi:K+-sensing histidine kinase KdpD
MDGLSQPSDETWARLQTIPAGCSRTHCAIRRHPATSACKAGRKQPMKSVWRCAIPGAGIPAEDMPHAFECFYRVDKSRSRALGGTSIGLTVARTAVEAVRGRVYGESDGPGRDATFRFTVLVAA